MYTNKYLEKLEYNKIVEILSSFCITYVGKDICYNLMPQSSKNLVEQMLAETREAVNLIYRNSTPPFFEISNIDISIKSLESSSTLSAKSILDLANIFKLCLDLKNYFDKDFITSSDFPILSDLFDLLYTNKDVISKVFSCIIDENTIDDNASTTLRNIRKKQRNLEQDIRSKLNDFIHSSKYSKYIQEPIITIRNDRFVIPVKEEYRSQVKGFIHDMSNAGSTVFMEPILIFELNNEVNNLKIEEEIEIEKILQYLSSLFYDYTNELSSDVETIGKLDFIFAKAKYSNSINAITPIINEEKCINLINARHPLIPNNKVVPISLKLDSDSSVLLITGPNTGGKTVSLKTTGLLACMACSGLNIPADEKSSIYVFDSIFADIGDNQSISESLSTFSSHMLNIVDIIDKSTKNSLILVDELGSGTDPLEGANLAISILEYFKNNGSLVIATTHYPELKKYALVTKGFQNASVEFDINTLSPTYRLLLGIPGKSNAFEISEKLGLDKNIIDNAKSRMSNQDINIEELLKNIYDDKSEIEKEKEEISKALNQVSLLRKKLEVDYSDLEKKKRDLIDNAKIMARNILLEAKDEANDIIKQMNEISNNSFNNIIGNGSATKELNNLRNELNDKIKNVSGNVGLNDALKNRLNINLSLNSLSDNGSSENLEKLDKSNILSPDEIKPNMEVFVTTLNQNATVISRVSKSNTVQIQIGMMKTNVDIKYLRKPENIGKSTSVGKLNNNSNSSKNNSSNNGSKNNSSNSIYGTSKTKINKTKTAKTEINVIGLNVEEAIFVVDKFLDDSALAGLQSVRIIHGKGTGKLKDGIHKFLKSNPHVKYFRLGTFGEGEMGVTVVELN